jgi:hypothetical protein
MTAMHACVFEKVAGLDPAEKLFLGDKMVIIAFDLTGAG